MHSGLRALGLILAAGAISAVVTAQSPRDASPTLEVASIRLNISGDTVASIGASPSGLITFTNVTIRGVIQRAYRVPMTQIVGGPEWLDREHYDVRARADSAATPERLMPVLQTLLAERLKLVVRTEKRDTPVFALVLAKADRRLGSQLQPSSMTCAEAQPVAPPAAPPICSGRSGPGFITAGGVTMPEVAESLSVMVGRTVVDRTNLQGRFDLDLKWASDRFPPPGPDRGAFVSELMNQQLGLSLQPTRAPVDFLVVESVERPTEN
jgi:uncharacterized protein (TIGR03435 family)